jgi:hypothetical protein
MWSCASPPGDGSVLPNHIVLLQPISAVQSTVHVIDSEDDRNVGEPPRKKSKTEREVNVIIDNETTRDITGVPPVAETDRWTPLPSNKFLQPSEVFKLLRESHGQFPKVIPTGSKDNVYMVVDNVDNVTRRLNGLHSNFPDDCGVWQSSKASTTSVPYLVVGQQLGRRLYFRNGKYCRERRRATVRFYEPLDPQPMDSDVVRLISYYSTLAADPTYKRRITWIADAKVQIAVVEYEGKFPGRIAHGNSSNSDEHYTRTRPTTMQSMASSLPGKTPKQVYAEMVISNDEEAAPRNSKQVRNMKYRLNVNQRSSKCDARSTVADEVACVINMVRTDSFVRHVVVSNDKIPAVVLCTDQQIADITNFAVCQMGAFCPLTRHTISVSFSLPRVHTRTKH